MMAAYFACKSCTNPLPVELTLIHLDWLIYDFKTLLTVAEGIAMATGYPEL